MTTILVLIVIGAFANNFLTAYFHGMISTVFLGISLMDLVYAIFSKRLFSESIEHHGEMMAIAVFMIIFHGFATVGALNSAAGSMGY
eukprot:CAMPEP_0113715064 /NCGR_PEP_ID=MMETSP0038_2-20120614/33032_1 /TAXON_ID=2898 /ORGANISM="Cryptomonas paramecium" /LENGTH=86 /DNA_ID=CAMNT_0000642245 /DNA_START=241 /DNA_END=498 /DNA_ORIENTATION=+ /assembly_acc=CAM_ASM_000170